MTWQFPIIRGTFKGIHKGSFKGYIYKGSMKGLGFWQFPRIRGYLIWGVLIISEDSVYLI